MINIIQPLPVSDCILSYTTGAKPDSDDSVKSVLQIV